jgi:hypothetical protein
MTAASAHPTMIGVTSSFASFFASLLDVDEETSVVDASEDESVTYTKNKRQSM